MPEQVRTRPDAGWREKARALKRDVHALYLAYRDPRVPWYAKVWLFLVAAYAFSPIDLIPDPIPILGQLDDLVLVPLGVAIAIRLVPAPVLAEYREKARQMGRRPISRFGGMVIAGLWLLALACAIRLAAGALW